LLFRRRADARVAGLRKWHPTNPALDLLNEVIFQNLFVQQCANLGVRNDFFPVGAAANYTLLYLLVRVLTEFRCNTIVEFGSGQSTILIDRIRAEDATHIAVEHDDRWHETLSSRLHRCEYILRGTEPAVHDGIQFDFYSNVTSRAFDLLVVDGPHGRDRYSRFGCVPYVLANANSDFVIVLDDFNRVGEQDTARYLMDALEARSVQFRAKQILGAKSQLVIAAGSFLPFLYCW
jgi:hypothetical protein